MTSPTTMALTELAAKAADADFVKQTLQFSLQRLMEMDVEALCEAAYGERSEERINSRNGYRDRTWETRDGTVDLKILKLSILTNAATCSRRPPPPVLTDRRHPVS